MKMITIVSLLILSSSSFCKNIAKVKVLRGDVKVLTQKEEHLNLKKGDWVKEGHTVVTGKKSFVRLTFVDDSKVNIGPNSKVKVEQFKEDAPGVLSVVTGKIRAEVSKDYLKMQKNKSKLFVRSNNAVMGIRGTDFLFTSNAKTNNTVAILFEGSVVFNKLNKKDVGAISKYESIVSRGQVIKPGEFSIVSTSGTLLKSQKLNKAQLINLKINKEISTTQKSTIPDGLTKSLVSSGDKKDVVIDNAPVIHIGTGSVISSTLIKDGGEISTSGEFVLPENAKVDSDGSIVSVQENANQIKQIPQPEGENYKPASFLHTAPKEAQQLKKPSKVNINIKQPIE